MNEQDVYADVEELLYPGYITETVVCEGITVSFRSAYSSDLQLLRVRSPSCHTVHDWKVLAVAHAAWEVDGHVVQAGDTATRRRLEDLFRNVTAPVLDFLYAAVITIRTRVTDAASLFEAYCYELQSRSNWRMFGRRCPSVQSPAWVAAAGSNSLQRLWVSYNLYEDDRIRWENDWYAATTVAATMAPKWVKEIRTEESNRWKAEVERREAAMRKARKLETTSEESEQGRRIVRHRTNEDLIEQMKRWQRGELDDHDQIVRDYKDNIRRRHEAERIAHERRMEALEAAKDAVPGADSVVGYTPEQLSEMGLDAPTRARRVYDAGFSGQLYDKYLEPNIPVGGLRPDGKGGDMDVTRPPISKALANRRVTVPEAGGD